MDPKLLAEYRKQRRESSYLDARSALNYTRSLMTARRSPFYRCGDGEVEYQGRMFKVRAEWDDLFAPPWENSDPLAEVVSERCAHAHLPAGWVWLQRPTVREYGVRYNKRAALAAVRTWGPRYNVEQVVEREIELFRGWLENRWHYIGLIVKTEVDGREFEDSLWGIDDCDEENVATTLEELADNLIHEIQRATYPVTECGV